MLVIVVINKQTFFSVLKFFILTNQNAEVILFFSKKTNLNPRNNLQKQAIS